MAVTAEVVKIPSRTLPLRTSERRTMLVVGDVVLLLASVVAALWLWTIRGDLEFSTAFLVAQAQWFVVLPGLWFVTASALNFYRPDITSNIWATGLALLKITAAMLLIYFLIYFVSPPNSLNRVVVIFFGLISLALIGGWRSVYALGLNRSIFEQRVVIVGTGRAGQEIAQAINAHLGRTYRVVGFVDDLESDTAASNLPVLGAVTDLPRLAQQFGVSEIVLAQPYQTRGILLQALMDCQERGVQITQMALLYESITGRVPIEHVGDQWFVVLPMDHVGNSTLYSAFKRVVDILFAATGLLLFLPLLPVLALAIRLDSPGPVFYRQRRVGKGGRVFSLYKLRSMVHDAEPTHAVWCAPNDPRMTRVGHLIRSFRLDEFPQLVNILKGDMSLVGPRPERPEMVAELERSIPFYRVRHSVRPGATGWAFLHSGYARSVEETLVKLQYDLYYIKHQSLALDLLIAVRTLATMFTRWGT